MDCSMPSSSSFRTKARIVAFILSVPAMPGAYPSDARTRIPPGSPEAIRILIVLRDSFKDSFRHHETKLWWVMLTIKLGISIDGPPEVGGTTYTLRGGA